MNTLPAQFSPISIQRFVPLFDQVKSAHPNVIKVSYEPLAFDTFTCRFRDAAKGVVVYGQCPELLSQVQPWYHDFTVARDPQDPKKVLIGGAKEVRDFKKQKKTIGTVVDAQLTLGEVESPSEKVLVAILTLLNFHIISDATLKGANEEMVALLISKHCPDRVLEILPSGPNLVLL